MPTHTGTASTPLQFSGQYTDAETGLVYLRARYYDPTTAQFLTIDPLLPATGTPYAYVVGNPLNAVDPAGTCASGDTWCWITGTAKVVSGAAEVLGAEEVGGGLFGAESIIEGLEQLADPGQPAPQMSTTEYTDGGGGACSPSDPTGAGIDRGDGRDILGHFAGASGYGKAAEAAGLAKYASRTGLQPVSTQVRASLGDGSSRYYDGLALKADGTWEGVEVKSGVARKSASQTRFDESVNNGNAASALLNGSKIRITSVADQWMPYGSG